MRSGLPPPLPPETRTVGQLVAEAIRLYGRRFWLALPLGVPLAVADQIAFGLSLPGQIAVLAGFAPVFTAVYAAAVAIAEDRRPARRAWLVALIAGTVAFLPAALLLPWFALLGFAWLALVGLVVPVGIVEERGLRTIFGRAVRLARADYVHALGSLAALAVVFAVSRIGLALLLRGQGDQTERIAIFVADLVISPLLFLGAALLYFDQAARVRSAKPRRR